MSKLLEIGDTLPDFKIKDFEGNAFSLGQLLGAPFVLYFYPKDSTPGCTKEACAFRDVIEGFEDVDISVAGVSPDSPESHRSFMEENELNFPLLSDERLELSGKCGVLNDSRQIIRSTFICDADGIVLWVESPVDIEGHVQRVIEATNEVLA